MRLDELLFIRSDVLLERNRLIFGGRPIALERFIQLIDGHVEAVCNQGKIRANIAALLTNQETGDRRVIVHQKPAVAIEELAPGSEDGHFANTVLLRQVAVVLRAQHLQPPQTGEQHQQNSHDDCTARSRA